MTEESPEATGYQGGSKAQKNKNVKNFWGNPEKAEAYKKRVLKWGALYARDCSKCGAPLGFARTGEGWLIPLDLRSPVFCVTAAREGAQSQEYGAIRTELSYVSHFSTCPSANEFSQSKKGE